MGQNHPKRIPCEPTHLFPIKELIEELDSEVFWQIHRGTVVNLRAISKVIRETDGRPRIQLRDLNLLIHQAHFLHREENGPATALGAD